MVGKVSTWIVNVVATCRLPFKVDLESLVGLFPKEAKLNLSYPKYKCAYLKADGMEDVVTVFGSGAMIGVGSRSVEAAKRDLSIAYNMILGQAERLSYTEVNTRLSKVELQKS
jgi:TATA-box binding protein (TBP) (component of TFIID and TFIIIB)